MKTAAPNSTSPANGLTKSERAERLKGWIIAVVLAVVWWQIYGNLSSAAHWLTYSAIGLGKGSHMGDAVEFFVFEAPKVLMLLLLVVFAVGIIRTYFTPEHTRAILAGKRESVGNVLAALLGIVTFKRSCLIDSHYYGFLEIIAKNHYPKQSLPRDGLSE